MKLGQLTIAKIYSKQALIIIKRKKKKDDYVISYKGGEGNQE